MTNPTNDLYNHGMAQAAAAAHNGVVTRHAAATARHAAAEGAHAEATRLLGLAIAGDGDAIGAEKAQATAQLELTQINVKRDTPLAQARAIAQSQLDSELQAQKTAEAYIATSQAAIVTARASIQAAEAAVKTCELNLGFTKVRSLLDGIAGIAAVQIGNLVSPSTVLTTVSQVDPIKVYFPIAEQEYLKVSGLTKTVRGDGWMKQGSATQLKLLLADGSLYTHPGRVYFTDRQVDPKTGTIRVVATFPNPGTLLRPGQFGRVQAVKETARGAVLVPQRAIWELQGRYQIAVVGPDNRVSLRSVKVGTRVDTLWVIESGLQPGERVITEGGARVADGAMVTPKEN